MRLSKIHQLCLYCTFTILFLSGAIWIGIKYGPEMTTGHYNLDDASGFQTLSMKIHGAAAMLFLVVFGSLIPGHVRAGLKARRNLWTGISMVAFTAILTLTGYLLYYSGDELWRDTSGLIHMLLGIVTVPLLAWHVRSGTRN